MIVVEINVSCNEVLCRQQDRRPENEAIIAIYNLSAAEERMFKTELRILNVDSYFFPYPWCWGMPVYIVESQIRCLK